MKLNDQKRIAASRDAVWAGLNDPEILKASIPGCETLEKVSDTEFSAEVRAKVGPVKAKFKGNVTLSDLNPPESYRISGEGKGGAAGFAKGGAVVTLEEDGDGTILKYDVDADVGGKLAQIGARLLEGTTTKLAGEFFDNFEAALVGPGEDDSSDDAAAAPSETVTPSEPAEETANSTSSPVPNVAAAMSEARSVDTKSSKAKMWAVLGIIFVVGALALTVMQ